MKKYGGVGKAAYTKIQTEAAVRWARRLAELGLYHGATVKFNKRAIEFFDLPKTVNAKARGEIVNVNTDSIWCVEVRWKKNGPARNYSIEWLEAA